MSISIKAEKFLEEKDEITETRLIKEIRLTKLEKVIDKLIEDYDFINMELNFYNDVIAGFYKLKESKELLLSFSSKYPENEDINKELLVIEISNAEKKIKELNSNIEGAKLAIESLELRINEINDELQNNYVETLRELSKNYDNIKKYNLLNLYCEKLLKIEKKIKKKKKEIVKRTKESQIITANLFDLSKGHIREYWKQN